MKRQSSNIMYEIKLNFFNKSVFVVLVLMVMFLVLNYANCISDFQGSVKTYQMTYESLLEDGEDVDSLLQQEFHITEERDSNGGLTQFVDNTLRYDYENMQEKYSDIFWMNCIRAMLKNSTLVYLGLLFSLYMVFISTYEFSTNMVKTHMLIESPLHIAWSKLQSGLIIITGIYFVGIVISWLIASVWSFIYLKNVAVEVPMIVYGLKTIMKSVFISYLVIILFSILSYSLGLLLRHMAVAVGVNLMLHLLIPSFGKYDYKNLVMAVYKSAYQLEQGTALNYFDGVTPVVAFLIVVAYACIIFILAFLRFYKNWRSGQNW